MAGHLKKRALSQQIAEVVWCGSIATRQNFMARMLVVLCYPRKLGYIDGRVPQGRRLINHGGKKRSIRRDDPEDSSRKRLKVVHEAPTWEEVHTSRQLRQLLTFDQDLKKARHGMKEIYPCRILRLSH